MASIAPLPGITMQPISGERLMLKFVRIEPGAIVPDHQHPHEQAGKVLEGTLILTAGGETRELRYGDAYVVPGDMPHSATSVDGCLVVDIFSPPREDYLIHPPE